MKKLLFGLTLVAAVGFTSCGAPEFAEDGEKVCNCYSEAGEDAAKKEACDKMKDEMKAKYKGDMINEMGFAGMLDECGVEKLDVENM